jgi:hypothetical protein
MRAAVRLVALAWRAFTVAFAVATQGQSGAPFGPPQLGARKQRSANGLASRLQTCTPTVLGLMNNAWAIWRLLCPAATSGYTSPSRGRVPRAGDLGGAPQRHRGAVAVADGQQRLGLAEAGIGSPVGWPSCSHAAGAQAAGVGRAVQGRSARPGRGPAKGTKRRPSQMPQQLAAVPTGALTGRRDGGAGRPSRSRRRPGQPSRRSRCRRPRPAHPGHSWRWCPLLPHADSTGRQRS